jgi:tripartite-type tricarboxylate transporter receptor subunit TctC
MTTTDELKTARSRLRRHCALSICAAGMVVIAVAAEQDYPVRPIKLVVPYTAGSVQDLRARHIASLLEPRLRQPLVVDNRPGGNGAIGSAAVAKAKPDG